MTQVHIFEFERDFARSLRCIPMVVRHRLDVVGIKLSLRQWSRIRQEEREELGLLAFEGPAEVDGYRNRVLELIALRSPEPARFIAVVPEPPWAQLDETPAEIVEHAQELGQVAPTLAQWRSLTLLQRFALYKLTREGHENRNFGPALREFGLTA